MTTETVKTETPATVVRETTTDDSASPVWIVVVIAIALALAGHCDARHGFGHHTPTVIYRR